MTNPGLEYNLAGGLLLTITEGDFRRLQEQLVEAGFGHACVLPFRVLAKRSGVEALKNSPLDIVHFEEAWNPTSQDNLGLSMAAGVLGKLKRMAGNKNQPPIPQDAFFPSKRTCDRLFRELMAAFPDAKFISHEVKTQYDSGRWLLEINPSLKMQLATILEGAKERGVGLVFDPRHLLPSGSALSLPGQATKAPRGEWERQFQYFRSGLEVVDINGNVDELFREGGELRELAQAAKETSSIRFLRVEIPIPPGQQLPGIRQSQEKGFQFLREIGQALREA
jgi:hypothetical protein